MSPQELLLLLVGAHCLADFPLQGAFLAEAKNPQTALGGEWWPVALPAHALIHGFTVTLLTGSAVLGLAEAVAHAALDVAKCYRLIGLRTDQAAHLACKVAWWALTLWTGGIP